MPSNGFDDFAREEIAASWRRSVLSGLRPERLDVPYDPETNTQSRLEWAARPILASLVDNLGASGVALVVTDEHANVLKRRVADSNLMALLDAVQLAPGFRYSEPSVGTNGIGTAIEQGSPIFVQEFEHFSDALTNLSCAAAPIRDPGTGRVIGVVDLTCRARDAHPLMLPFARHAAWEVEQRLLADVAMDERVLIDPFLRERRRAREPFVCVSPRTLLSNSAAAVIVQSADRELLWSLALQAFALDQSAVPEILLASGTVVAARCKPVQDGDRIIGALLWIEMLPQSGDAATWHARRIGAERPKFGWASLTDAERSVTEFVSRGMTNRETAAQMFLSPHTVNIHLRRIFGKLEIESRVDLARLVAERRATTAAP